MDKYEWTEWNSLPRPDPYTLLYAYWLEHGGAPIPLYEFTEKINMCFNTPVVINSAGQPTQVRMTSSLAKAKDYYTNKFNIT